MELDRALAHFEEALPGVALRQIVVTVEEDTPIPAVALHMAQQGIHRVIVVDKQGQLRGIVTSMDVLWWVAAQG